MAQRKTARRKEAPPKRTTAGGREPEYAVVYIATARFKDGSAAGAPTVTVVGNFASAVLARRAAAAARQGPNVSVIGFPIRVR